MGFLSTMLVFVGFFYLVANFAQVASVYMIICFVAALAVAFRK